MKTLNLIVMNHVLLTSNTLHAMPITHASLMSARLWLDIRKRYDFRCVT